MKAPLRRGFPCPPVFELLREPMLLESETPLGAL